MSCFKFLIFLSTLFYSFFALSYWNQGANCALPLYLQALQQREGGYLSKDNSKILRVKLQLKELEKQQERIRDKIADSRDSVESALGYNKWASPVADQIHEFIRDGLNLNKANNRFCPIKSESSFLYQKSTSFLVDSNRSKNDDEHIPLFLSFLWPSFAYANAIDDFLSDDDDNSEESGSLEKSVAKQTKAVDEAKQTLKDFKTKKGGNFKKQNNNLKESQDNTNTAIKNLKKQLQKSSDYYEKLAKKNPHNSYSMQNTTLTAAKDALIAYEKAINKKRTQFENAVENSDENILENAYGTDIDDLKDQLNGAFSKVQDFETNSNNGKVRDKVTSDENNSLLLTKEDGIYSKETRAFSNIQDNAESFIEAKATLKKAKKGLTQTEEEIETDCNKKRGHHVEENKCVLTPSCQAFKSWQACAKRGNRSKSRIKIDITRICNRPDTCRLKETGVPRLGSSSEDGGSRFSRNDSDTGKECKKSLKNLKKLIDREKILDERIEELKETLEELGDEIEAKRLAQLLSGESTEGGADCLDCRLRRLREIKEIVDPGPSGWEILGRTATALGGAALGYFGMRHANKRLESQGFPTQPGMALGLAFPFIQAGLYGGGMWGNRSSLACSPTVGGNMWGGGMFPGMMGGVNFGGNFPGMFPGMMGGVNFGGNFPGMFPGMMGGVNFGGNFPGMFPGMMGGVNFGGNFPGMFPGMMGGVNFGGNFPGMFPGMMGGVNFGGNFPGMFPGMFGGNPGFTGGVNFGGNFPGMFPGMMGRFPGMTGGFPGMNMMNPMMGLNNQWQQMASYQQMVMSWRQNQMRNWMQRQQAASSLYQEINRLQMQIQDIMMGGGGIGGNFAGGFQGGVNVGLGGIGGGGSRNNTGRRRRIRPKDRRGR